MEGGPKHSAAGCQPWLDGKPAAAALALHEHHSHTHCRRRYATQPAVLVHRFLLSVFTLKQSCILYPAGTRDFIGDC